MIQVKGRDPELFVGVDPSTVTNYAAALDIRGPIRLYTGELMATYGRGTVTELRVGDHVVDPELVVVLTLEDPRYRGRGENQAAGQMVQQTISNAGKVELLARLFGAHVIKMDNVTVTRNMTSYYSDKATWDNQQRRIYAKAQRTKFPQTRMSYVVATLTQHGLKAGRGTILNSSHYQDAALTMLAGMRHMNADLILRHQRPEIEQ